MKFHRKMLKIADSTECICGYGFTKIANDGVIRFAIIIYIVAFAV